jgi:hypothetical protein
VSQDKFQKKSKTGSRGWLTLAVGRIKIILAEGKIYGGKIPLVDYNIRLAFLGWF